MSRILATDISAYGNILINSSERLETFKETLENWQSRINIEMKIRIRGTYAEEAADHCMKFSKITVEKGSDFIQWRNQALFDVQKVNSKYVMIFLEDHQIISTQNEFRSIVDSMERENVDILQYSWFQHYDNLRNIIKIHSHKSESEIFSLFVDNQVYKKFIRPNETYLISLTSIFSHELLVKILKTRRPFLKRYDARGPFDVEKSPFQHFFLPIKFALPVIELALCVDDEMGIVGSSAISRGLSNLPLTKRGENHYSKISPKYWVSKARSKSVDDSFAPDTSSLVLFKRPISLFLNFANIASNTLLFFIFEFIDLRKEGAKN